MLQLRKQQAQSTKAPGSTGWGRLAGLREEGSLTVRNLASWWLKRWELGKSVMVEIFKHRHWQMPQVKTVFAGVLNNGLPAAPPQAGRERGGPWWLLTLIALLSLFVGVIFSKCTELCSQEHNPS